MSKARIFVLSVLLSCTETKIGNPQLVKDAQEIADLGCKCTDVSCLHKVEVRGKNYAQIRLGSGVKDLREDERMAFNLALGRFAECEYKLTQKKE